MSQNPKISTEKILFGIFGVALFSYVLLRAFSLSITHDEAYTFLRYVPSSYGEIASYNTGNILPNNHILNTLGMKLFSSLFGVKDWIVRLPNVLGFIVYLVFAWKISSKFSNRVVAWFLILALTLIQYQLEFFSLARGYGLSIAFLLPALYFLQVYLEEGKMRSLWYALGAAFLSIEASFTLLYFFVPLGGSLLIYASFNGNKKLIQSMIIFLIFLVVVLYEPLRFLISSGTLFGPTEGFYKTTLFSLSLMIVPEGTPNSYAKLIMVCCTILFILSWLLIILRQTLLKKPVSTFFLLFGAALGLCILSQIVGAAFFDRHLLTFRTALVYYPLFFLFLAYALQHAIELIPSKHSWSMLWFPGIIGLLLAGNFVMQVQTQTAREWAYEEHSRETYFLIKSDIRERGITEPVSVGITWLFEPALNFYRQADNDPAVKPFNRNGLASFNQYQYIVPSDTGSVSPQLDLWIEYPSSGNRLFRSSP